MSINKKYIMAGMLATALVVPLTDTTDSHADDTRVITGRVNFRTGPDKSYPSMGKIEKGESGWKIQGTVTVIEDIAGSVPIPEKHEENQTVNEFN